MAASSKQDFRDVTLDVIDGDEEICSANGWPVENQKVKLAYKLEHSSDDYILTSARLEATCVGQGVEVVDVWRVQNPAVYRKYENMKKHYDQTYGRCEVKSLWHGTKLHLIESILKENLDTRYVGSKGTRYGRGVNFSAISYYASHLCDKSLDKYLLYCDVLVANIKQVPVGIVGSQPPIMPGQALRYDTTTKNIEKLDVVVKFGKDEFYPKFVVQITHFDVFDWLKGFL